MLKLSLLCHSATPTRIVFFWKVYFIHLKGNYNKKERQRKNFLLLIHLLNGHNGYGWVRLKLGVSSRSHMWECRGLKHGPSFIASPGALAGSWLGSGAGIPAPRWQQLYLLCHKTGFKNTYLSAVFEKAQQSFSCKHWAFLICCSPWTSEDLPIVIEQTIKVVGGTRLVL